MTDAEKAAAYDDLVARIVEALKAQGYGTPSYRSYDDLKAELDDLNDALGICEGHRTQLAGERDEARRLLAACEAKLPKPPEPPREWKLLKSLARVRDWDGVLDSAPGSSITDQPDGSIRLYQPNRGERCELQLNDDRLGEGVTARYSWEVWISSDTKLDPTGSGTDTICQQHGNNQSGYGGGLTVRAADKELIVRVKGGKRLSRSGAQRYEYESDGKGGSPPVPDGADECGTLTFGTWHRIVYEVRWSKVWDGYVSVKLDDGPATVIEDVPTMCEPADVELFRLGFYSSDGPVPKDMRIRSTKVEVLS